MIRVALLDSARLLRAAFRCLLEQSHLEVVGDGGTISDALEILSDRRPDVLIVDIVERASIASIAELSKLDPRPRMLVVTGDLDPQLHEDAVEAGAMGVVLYRDASECLIKAIQKVHAGEYWLDRSRIGELLQRLTNRRRVVTGEQAKVALLTPREMELLRLLCEGLKNKHLAERLRISEATVRNHLTSILDKLEVSGRFELVVYAFRHGLVQCPKPEAAEIRAS